MCESVFVTSYAFQTKIRNPNSKMTALYCSMRSSCSIPMMTWNKPAIDDASDTMINIFGV